MSRDPAPDLIALRLRQGNAWIDTLADIEGWPDPKRAQCHDALHAVPLQAIEAVVERWRERMREALECAGQLPSFTRTRPWGSAAPSAPRSRAPRGIARHLVRKPVPQPGRNGDLFPDTDEGK